MFELIALLFLQETTEINATAICKVHGRELFMYLPAIEGASYRTAYWSCAAQRRPLSLVYST